MNQTTSSLTRAWSGTVGANALILLFGIATGILAARLLGPADRGLLAVVMFWPGLLVGICFLSLGEAIVFRANNTSVERRRFIATAAIVSLALTIPTMVMGALSLPLLLGPERADAVPLATAYLLAFVPLNFVASALLAIDHAECRFSRYNLLRLLPSGVYLLGLLLLWGFGFVSVETAIWASWFGTALTALIRLWSWRRDLIARPAVGEALALLRQGLLFHGTTLVTILSAQADRLIVIRFFPDADIGHYVVALTIATAGLGLVTNSVHTVLFPRLSAEPDRAKAQAQLRLGLQRSTLFLIAGSALAVLLIPYLLPLLFGADFAPAIAIALLLILAYIPLALRQIIVRCLRAFGDARSGLLAESAALGVFFMILVPMAYSFGLLGVPLALACANIIGLTVACFQLRSNHQIFAKDWLWPSWAMLADAVALAGRFNRFNWAQK